MQEPSAIASLPQPSRLQLWIVRCIRWHLLHPLTVAGVLALAGIFVAECWRPAGQGALVGLMAASLILGLWFRTRWSWSPLLFLSYLMLHAHQLQQTYHHPLHVALTELSGKTKAVQLQARLYPWPDGVSLNESRALAEIVSLRWGQQESAKPVTAKVRVTLPARFKLATPGLYELSGNLSLPPEPMNPGQFNMRDYALRNGWIADLQAVTVRLVSGDAWAPRFHLLRWAEASRQWITAALSLGIQDQKTELGVLLAMALGVSDAAGQEVEDAFRGSGTLHIFAISGLHVVMLAGVMGFILRWSGLRQSRAVAWLVVLVFCYAYITGWRPSAARAALMISVLLVAPWWDRKPMIQNSLGAALLLLLAMDTQQLFNIGFQLSFAVLWAILLFATPLMKLMEPWTSLDPFLPPQLASPWVRWLAQARLYLAGLVSVSLAAWMGSFPLMIGHFKTLNPVGLVANLILVPASGLSMTLSCASLVCTVLGLSSAQALVNGLNAWVAQIMIALTAWFAAWPFANVTLDLRFEKDTPPVEMQVFHLTTGGSSLALRVGDRYWLLDTGDSKSWRNIIHPYLRQHGVDELQGVVLSHSDVKHVGASLQAAQWGRPRMHTSLHEPFRTDPPFSSLRRLAQTLPVDSGRWHRHVMGDLISLGSSESLPVSLSVLYPMEQDAESKADDRSLALLIQIGSTRLLWLPDAGYKTLETLIQRHPDLRADIIIHSQHGTDLSHLPTLVRRVKPQLVIGSEPPLLSGGFRLSPLSTRQLNLYQCGSVNLRFDPHGVEIRTFSTAEKFRVETPEL